MAIFAMCYVGAWAAYAPFLRGVTSAGVFYDQQVSKIDHMHHNVRAGEVDYVFVGDSTTQYHINTYAFAAWGVNAYNLGVPGANLNQFQTLAHAAAKRSPGSVVMVLQTDVPFQRHWGWSGSEQLDEIADVWSLAASLRDRLSVVKQAALSTNRLAKVSPVIVDMVARAYERIGGIEDGDHGGLEPEPGCDPLTLRETEAGPIVRCKSGDGYTTEAGVDTAAGVANLSLGPMNAGKARFLNELHAELEARGVRLVLVLQPRFATDFAFDRSALVRALASEVIDLSGLEMRNDPALWADQQHLNVEGRARFTQALANALGTLVANRP